VSVGARSDYTLSRNMNGGLEIGFNRSHNSSSPSTVTALRLGFNLTFLF
jgi:hypothetical protein